MTKKGEKHNTHKAHTWAECQDAHERNMAELSKLWPDVFTKHAS